MNKPKETLSDRVFNLAVWLAIPTFMATEKSKNKYVRILGAIGIVVFIPMVWVATPVFMIALMLAMGHKED